MGWVDRVARSWAATMLLGTAVGSVSAEPWQPSSVDELLERHPSRSANAAALEVERLAAAIGVDLATRSTTWRPRPTAPAAEAFKEVKRELSGYLRHQLELPHSALEPPPVELTEWLGARATELDALREQLVRGPAPRWELQMERLYSAPVPNLLGHIELQRLLSTDALVRLEASDAEGALADLEASWRLNAALLDDPILITQLVTHSIIRMQIGVLRHVERAPAVWRERLADLDVRDRVLQALALESWVPTQLDDSHVIQAESNLVKRALLVFSGPYVRMCINEIHADWQRKLANLSRLDYYCDRDLAELDAELKVSTAWWNTIGDVYMPDLGSVPQRVARLELDIELTRKLLRLRAAREDNGGVWPPGLSRLSQSVVCPDDRWVYEVAGDGSMSIALDRTIEWPEQIGVFLPTSYSSVRP